MIDISPLAAERDKCIPLLVGTAQADALWTFCCSEEEDRQSSLIKGNESLSVLSESTPQKSEYCLIAREVLRQHPRFWAENSSRSTSVEAPMHVAVQLNAMYIMKILFEEIDREGGTAAGSSALVSKENQRNSPLQLAFQEWNEEILNFLVEKILRLDNLSLVKVLLSGENRIL
jgi:hypothetical protein